MLWVRATAELNRFVLRYWPASLGKMLVWRLINRLNARLGVELIGMATWGGRFACDLRDLIQARIYYTGVWEPSLTMFFPTCLSPGDVCVDVGANVGYFSVLAASIVGPTGRVVAIEASPSVFATLKRNVELNKVTNVRMLNIAAADAGGVVEVYAGPNTNVGTTSLLAWRGGILEGKVEARPLIDVLREAGLDAIKLIKIDVEGFETRVLRHLLAHVDELRPDVTIVAEVSPSACIEMGTTVEQLLADFWRAGFGFATLDNDYEWTGWYDITPGVPVPLSHVPKSQVDIVFSRGSASGGSWRPIECWNATSG